MPPQQLLCTGVTGQKTPVNTTGRSSGPVTRSATAAVRNTTAAAATSGALPVGSPTSQQHSATVSQVERVPATPLADAAEAFHSPAGTPVPAGTPMQQSQEDTGHGSMQQLMAELQAARAMHASMQQLLHERDAEAAALWSQLQAKDAELQAKDAELQAKDAKLQAKDAELQEEQDSARQARQDAQAAQEEVQRLRGAAARPNAAAGQPQHGQQRPAAASQPAPNAPASRAAQRPSQPAAEGARDEGGWQQQRRRGWQQQRDRARPAQHPPAPTRPDRQGFKAVVPVGCAASAEDLVAGAVSKLTPNRAALAPVLATRIHETKTGERYRVVLFRVPTAEGADRLRSALRSDAAKSLPNGVRLHEALPAAEYKAQQALRGKLMQYLRERHGDALALAREQEAPVRFVLRGTEMALYISNNRTATVTAERAAAAEGGRDGAGAVGGAGEPGRQQHHAGSNSHRTSGAGRGGRGGRRGGRQPGRAGE
jgi:Skp family chaperone for outer membrane proteins